jgi:hypothetical protein
MKINRRYKSISLLMTAIIILLVNENHTGASASLFSKVNIHAGSRSVQIPDSPEGGVSLVLDDGSAESAYGNGGISSFIFFNRFTPDPALFPFELTSFQVFFMSEMGVSVGDQLNLFVYEDADGNPANGATTLVLNYPVTVKALDTWNEYIPVLTEPLVIDSPGDVLIGIEALETPGIDYFPASIDSTNSQQRSWVGNSFLELGSLGIIDDSGYPGNWMIRGYGITSGTTSYLYLPTIFKPLSSPVLSPIDNPNGEAYYSVSWSSVDLATAYVLEEDDNGVFSSPVVAYSDFFTSWFASNHAVGTFYYRVKAHNSLGDSAWSNVQSTTVIPPQSTIYITNNTGCTLCYEIYGTGIGQKCFSSAGSNFYGSFPVGYYQWAASACCGPASDTDYFGEGTWEHAFGCYRGVNPQAGSSTLQCTLQSDSLTSTDNTPLP